MFSEGRSVRGRFLRVTVPLIFLSVIGVFGTIELMAHRSAVTRLEQTWAALLKTQSAALANPLWNLDHEQISLTLQATSANPEILVVRVYDEAGDILSESGNENNLRGDESVLRSKVTFDAGTGPRQIGELEFIATPRELWTQTFNRLLLVGGIAVLAVTMEVGAALFALRRIVGAPLERLLAAINSAKTGRGRRKVELGPQDELGQVMSAFNDMLTQQEVFERELQQQARMEGELQIGHDMQLSMVPRNFEALTAGHPIKLWAALEPAREVGGDFYDAFFIDDNILCLCIGDVSDKGVPAALLMAVTKTLIKANAVKGADPTQIITAVNHELCAGDNRDMFVTLFLALMDTRSGELRFTNAGHNPPLRLLSDGTVSILDDRHGPVVGAVDNIKYLQSEIRLELGETLFLYTDGVTEAASPAGEYFGETALKNLLSANRGATARALTETVVEAVSRHEGAADRTDDITLLTVSFEGPPSAIWQGSSEANLDAIATLGDEMAVALEGHSDDLIQRARLILDEIGDNIATHGQQAGSAPITIEAEAKMIDGTLHINISDNAAPFDPATAPRPDTTTLLQSRPIGGLGLHLVRNLSHDVRYEYDRGRNLYYVAVRS